MTDNPYYVSPEEEAENEREYPAGPVTEDDVMLPDEETESAQQGRVPLATSKAGCSRPEQDQSARD